MNSKQKLEIRKQKLETGNRKLEHKCANFQFLISIFCFLVSFILVSRITLKAGAPDPGSAGALIDAGHWKRARAILEPRLAANPRDAQGACLLSQVNLAFGDLDSALKFAQRAVALDDGSSNYHFQVA